MAYGSHIGDMPAYGTLQHALKGLATHEALIVKAHAKDPTKVGFLQFDNVQNYICQRDHRIGSTNKMNISIAATYCKLEGVDLAGIDFAEQQKLVVENRHTKLTIHDLLSIIDHKHLNTVFALHWLHVLVNSIPRLLHWKGHITTLFHEKASKLQLLIQPTKVHPLAWSFQG